MEPGNKSPGRKSLTSSTRCNGTAPVIVFPPKLATEDKSLEAVSRDGARTAESRSRDGEEESSVILIVF